MVSSTVCSVPGYVHVLSASRSAGSWVSDDVGDILHELLELVGVGSEVGLGVDLDDDADAILDHCIDSALSGNTASLLGGGSKALLTQPLDGLVDVAVGGDERLLAVHHANVGHFAQLLYIFRSECHGNFLLYLS